MARKRWLIIRAWIGCLVCIWIAEAGTYYFKQVDSLPHLFRHHANRSIEEQREANYGNWFKMLQLVRERVPEDSEVGIVCDENVRLMRRHFANYWLYPRKVFTDNQRDYVVLLQQGRLTPELIRKGTEKDYYLLAALDSYNYLFARKRPRKDAKYRLVEPPDRVACSAIRNNENTAKVLDGDLSTRWKSMKPMRPGDWFQVDLGEPQWLEAIRVWHYGFWDDFPRGYIVSCSLDGQSWTSSTETICEMLPDTYFQVELPAVPTRYIRIEQTGAHQCFFWSISEIDLLAARDVQ